MNKFIAMFVGLAFAFTLALQSPAQAFVGTWSQNEYTGTCTQELQNLYGAGFCPVVPSQAQAENICNCSGEKIADWTSNGHKFKNVNYNSTAVQGNVILTYRQWDTGDPYKLQDKLWCTPDGCQGNTVK